MDVKAIKNKILKSLYAVELEKLSLNDLRFYVDIVKETSEIKEEDESNKYVDMFNGMIEKISTTTYPTFTSPNGELKKDGE